LTDALDTGTAHVARVYDYWLGGKDNFEADRRYGDDLEKRVPSIRTTAQMNRLFLGRAVRYLTAEAGIRQFLDIGTGLPTANNTHQVAQAIAPESRVVYADNDPMVLAHALALLTSSPSGKTAYIDADLRNPGAILGAKQSTATLDLDQPVAVLLIASASRQR
jgi:S-adenosyl methyltransferase